MNNNPFGYMNWANQQSSQPQEPTNEKPYKKQNNTTHFVMGVAAGAAVAYLLTNKKFKEGATATGKKAWSAVRGEVEELKERLEDTQAELEYYRNLHKDEE